jgi:hypothetical protein
VPATPSSPIPATLTPLTHADPRQLPDAEAPHLLAYLASVPDPRAAPGRRHRLVAILGLAAVAVLAGARSIAAIAEWAADSPQPVRAALGTRHHAPGHYSVPAEAAEFLVTGKHATTCCGGQGQPAHPAGPLRRSGLASRARRRPHP